MTPVTNSGLIYNRGKHNRNNQIDFHSEQYLTEDGLNLIKNNE